ncbi:Acyl-CoA dehydrogenase type 2 domain protein [Crinalium epipsammum PCC 9333]|uniref:Acyl-CoA dehydrogenase type 2 domain protein n=1 Tax=Crinalium epipsammum PCC 9333 TaxID=1173022 RepID=K9VUR3_9CYAN|nr:acyl-CoA dehydrogenase family protein [Crinalium epipsammum]AFZ11691.1 Acyl-CoA dehydrogenase type 2 domain protein [Crinalium epipsammum PCC 9333]
MISNLTVNKQTLIERISQLARDKFATRASSYDRTASFPTEDFEDLFNAGLNAPTVPTEYGGLGLGHDSDIFTLWMMTKELAKVDLSLARCWEGHANAQILLTAMANESQKKCWFEGIVQRGEKWAAWSGEPQSQIPDQKVCLGTTVQVVNDGYILDGTKVFATSAPAVQWAVLLVNPAGAGGSRHSNGSPTSVLMLACNLSDPSISFDDSWWQPIGMKGTVSYLVRFKQTFIPKENLIGYPGQYILEEWQTRFTPQYGAAFLGSAEGAYEYTLAYIKKQEKGHDPYVQHRIAKAAINIDTMHFWLRQVATLWETGQELGAKLAGNRARYITEQLATETVNDCIHACGARSLIQPSPIERILRDLSFYVLHDNSDRVLSSIGGEILGQSSDRAYFNTHPIHCEKPQSD